MSQPNPEGAPQLVEVPIPQNVPLEILDTDSTPQQINVWFYSTPRNQLVSRVADTIHNWGNKDMRILRLAKRGFSQYEIVTLLKTRRGRDPVIHILLRNCQRSLTNLLNRVTSPINLRSLVRLEDANGANVLCSAFLSDQRVYDYLEHLLRKAELDKMVPLLASDIPPLQIDAWFNSTLRQHLISRLIHSMKTRSDPNKLIAIVKTLRLAERRLSQEEIIKLLSAERNGRFVIHLLVEKYDPTITTLLDQITSPDHFSSLITLKNWRGRNVLRCAFVSKSPVIFNYLVQRLREAGSAHLIYQLMETLEPDPTRLNPDIFELWAWCCSIPDTHRVSHLADTIAVWGTEDLSSLLAHIIFCLSPRQIVELLRTRRWGNPIILIMTLNKQTSTLTDLLDRVKSGADHESVLSHALCSEDDFHNLMAGVILNPSMNSQQIEEWFDRIPHEYLISDLANAVAKWGNEDLSRLKLAERNITEEEIVNLLKTRTFVGRNGRSDPVIYLLVEFNQTSTFIALLDRVTSPQRFISLVRMNELEELSVILHSFKSNKFDIYHYLVKRLQDESPNLLYDLMAAAVLNPSCNSQQIEVWFDRIPHEYLISNLANAVAKWGNEDLSRLKLVERNITEEEIVNLLETRPLVGRNGRSDPVIYLLVEFNQTSTFIALLDRVTSPQRFISLVRMNELEELSVILHSFTSNKFDIYHYLVKRLQDESPNLLYDLMAGINRDSDPMPKRIEDSIPLIDDTEGIYSDDSDPDEDDSVDILDPDSTPQEINAWFDSTPDQHLISCLADSIWEWGNQDLGKLKLADRISSEENTLKLLKTKPTGLSNCVVHNLVIYKQTSTFTALLDQVKSHQHLLSILRLKDVYGRNVLSCAFKWNISDASCYLMERLNVHTCIWMFNLLCEQDSERKTALHWAVGSNDSFGEVLSRLKDETQIHHILSIKDDNGRTVLSHCIYRAHEETFHSITNAYTNKQPKLLELAAITDNEGNTSFHYAAGQRTSNFIIDLIKSTCSLKTRKQLVDVLSNHNISGEKMCLGKDIDEWHSDNELIYNWAIDSITNEQYLLFDLPSVLVMYTTVDRPNADAEAQAFIASLESIGLNVKPVKNFTKTQLTEEIDTSQNSSGKNGQIVAMMGHGVNGYIKDNEGKKIPLKKIELDMHVEDETPKLMILQSCMRNKTYATVSTQTTMNFSAQQEGDLNEDLEICVLCADSDDDDDDDDSDSTCGPFESSARHFCLLSGCSPSQSAKRELFLRALGKAFENAQLNDDISKVMKSASFEVMEKREYQVPRISGQMVLDFCIKNILPIYLASKRADRAANASPSTP